CQILPKGVVSVIGPASSPASGSTVSHICGEKEIPHVKIGPEETPRLPYLRFASVTLYPSNEDLSLAIGSILRSFSYPSASLVCAKAECELCTTSCTINLYYVTVTAYWCSHLGGCKCIG
ncbi:Glutamate receptor ionotropic, kainate 5, partial [Xenotaenia resolanae]